MKTHCIKAPFMSKEGQFESGKHTLCVGLEVNALRTWGTYRVYIGLNKKDYYDITYDEALKVYQKHGKNALWKKGYHKVFILPLISFKHGVNEEIIEVKPRTLQPKLL